MEMVLEGSSASARRLEREHTEDCRGRSGFVVTTFGDAIPQTRRETNRITTTMNYLSSWRSCSCRTKRMVYAENERKEKEEQTKQQRKDEKSQNSLHMSHITYHMSRLN